MTTLFSKILFAFALGLAPIACGGMEGDDGLSESDDYLINTTQADGDSCDIPMPGGTKKPGTKKGDKCCSVFDENDCVDLPKDPAPTPPPTRTLGGRVVVVGGTTASRTP